MYPHAKRGVRESGEYGRDSGNTALIMWLSAGMRVIMWWGGGMGVGVGDAGIYSYHIYGTNYVVIIRYICRPRKRRKIL